MLNADIKYYWRGNSLAPWFTWFKYLFTAESKQIRVLCNYGLYNTSFIKIGQLCICFVRSHETIYSLRPSSLWESITVNLQNSVRKELNNLPFQIHFINSLIMHMLILFSKIISFEVCFLLLVLAHIKWINIGTKRFLFKKSIYKCGEKKYIWGREAKNYKLQNLIISSYRKLLL